MQLESGFFFSPCRCAAPRNENTRGGRHVSGGALTGGWRRRGIPQAIGTAADNGVFSALTSAGRDRRSKRDGGGSAESTNGVGRRSRPPDIQAGRNGDRHPGD